MTTVKDRLNLPSFESHAALNLDIENMTVVDWMTKSIDELINRLDPNGWGELRKSAVTVRMKNGMIVEPAHLFVTTDIVTEPARDLADDRVNQLAMQAISNISDATCQEEVKKFWENCRDALLCYDLYPTWEIRIEEQTFGSDTETGKTYYCITSRYDNPKGECLYVGVAIDLDQMDDDFKQKCETHLVTESSKSTLGSVH